MMESPIMQSPSIQSKSDERTAEANRAIQDVIVVKQESNAKKTITSLVEKL